MRHCFCMGLILLGCTSHREGFRPYDTYCGLCHGPDGEGYLAPQANALSNPEFLASASDDFLNFATVYGRTGTKMSAWGDAAGGPLTQESIDAVVAAMRSWQTLETVPLSSERIEGDPMAGAVAYAEWCSECHGSDGQGYTGLSLTNPTFLSSASDAYIRYAIEVGRSGTPMQGYDTTLADQDMNNIVAWIRDQETP